MQLWNFPKIDSLFWRFAQREKGPPEEKPGDLWDDSVGLVFLDLSEGMAVTCCALFLLLLSKGFTQNIRCAMLLLRTIKFSHKIPTFYIVRYTDWHMRG